MSINQHGNISHKKVIVYDNQIFVGWFHSGFVYLP